MNNGERILRAKGELTSLTGLIINLNYSVICQQVKPGSQSVPLMLNVAATL